MNLSELAFHLVIIFIPGIIATLIVKTLTQNEFKESFYFGIYALLFGFLSYLILQLIYYYSPNYISNDPSGESVLQIWRNLYNDQPVIPFGEVFYSCIISIFVGVIASAIINTKIIYSIGKFIRVSSVKGSVSLYYDFLQMKIDKKEVYYVYVRNPKTQLSYSGQVVSFYEDEKTRQLVLQYADVYSSENGEKLYSLQFLYLSISIEDELVVEVPFIESKDENVHQKPATTAK